MTGRERILAALHRQPVDRMPWTPLVDEYFSQSLPTQGRPDDLVAFLKEANVDIMERHVKGTSEILEDACYHEEYPAGHRLRIYETPHGSLTETRKYTGGTAVITGHFIQSYEDILTMTWLADHTSFAPDAAGFSLEDEKIAENGIATLTGPMSPIQELLQFDCGVENTVYFLQDYPDEMEALMAALHKRNLQHYKAMEQVPTAVVIDYEDTSTTVMSRDMFTQYSSPCIEEYSRIVRAQGKVFITHMCGKLAGFASEIGALNVDGIDSVCPPTTGDMPPWSARKVWPGKVIIGGIEPPHLRFMTLEQCLQSVVQCLLNIEDKTGFLLSTGDAVPCDTPMENITAISRLMAELGPVTLEPSPNPAQLQEAVQKVLRAYGQ